MTAAYRIITGDCRQVMPAFGQVDMIMADPPYGDTSLEWDRHVQGWLPLAAQALKPSGSIWIFGSMRFFLAHGAEIAAAGLRYAQDIVWEKHNGSGFAADRFRRVHEHVVQFYRADAPWSGVYNQPQMTADAVARTVRRKKRPPHLGGRDEVTYIAEDGGPRLMRSVIFARSCHGQAIHPTEKPVGLLETLIKTSTPPPPNSEGDPAVVADWFAGSGSAGEAAAMTGRRYIGCEIDAAMAQKARDRLAGFLFAGAAE